MNKRTLKARSRQSISWASPPVWLVSAVYALFGVAVSYIIPALKYDSLNNLLDNLLVSAYAMIIEFYQSYWYLILLSWILNILLLVVDAGYIKYCLDISRNNKPGFATLFELVPRALRYIGLGFLVQIIIGVPATIIIAVVLATSFTLSLSAAIPILMLIVGIAMIAYISLGLSMVTFVAVDNPDIGVFGCIKESWRLMKGRRGDYFALSISFFGWFILLAFLETIFEGVLPLISTVAIAIWLTPYMQVTFANYYNLITGQLPAENLPPRDELQIGDSRPPLDEDMWKK